VGDGKLAGLQRVQEDEVATRASVGWRLLLLSLPGQDGGEHGEDGNAGCRKRRKKHAAVAAAYARDGACGSCGRGAGSSKPPRLHP